MDFDFYTGDRGLSPTQLTAIYLASELNLSWVNFPHCLVSEIDHFQNNNNRHCACRKVETDRKMETCLIREI